MGGRGIFCTDRSSPHHGQLLDLFEAEAIWRFAPAPRDLNEEESLEYISGRYADYAYHPQESISREGLKNTVKDFLAKKGDVQFIKSGNKLLPVNDSLEPVVPEGCEIKQVAHFYTDKVLLIDPDLWNQMRPIDQSALMFHEILYFSLRHEGHSDSRFARYFVGKIASQDPINSPYSPLDKVEQYYYCDTRFENTRDWEAPHYKFYIYPMCRTERCEAVAQFTSFNGIGTFEMMPLHLSVNFDNESFGGSSGSGWTKINWLEYQYAYRTVSEGSDLYIEFTASQTPELANKAPSKAKCSLISNK